MRKFLPVLFTLLFFLQFIYLHAQPTYNSGDVSAEFDDCTGAYKITFKIAQPTNDAALDEMIIKYSSGGLENTIFRWSKNTFETNDGAALKFRIGVDVNDNEEYGNGVDMNRRDYYLLSDNNAQFDSFFNIGSAVDRFYYIYHDGNSSDDRQAADSIDGKYVYTNDPRISVINGEVFYSLLWRNYPVDLLGKEFQIIYDYDFSGISDNNEVAIRETVASAASQVGAITVSRDLCDIVQLNWSNNLGCASNNVPSYLTRDIEIIATEIASNEGRTISLGGTGFTSYNDGDVEYGKEYSYDLRYVYDFEYTFIRNVLGSAVSQTASRSVNLVTVSGPNNGKLIDEPPAPGFVVAADDQCFEDVQYIGVSWEWSHDEQPKYFYIFQEDQEKVVIHIENFVDTQLTLDTANNLYYYPVGNQTVYNTDQTFRVEGRNCQTATRGRTYNGLEDAGRLGRIPQATPNITTIEETSEGGLGVSLEWAASTFATSYEIERTRLSDGNKQTFNSDENTYTDRENLQVCETYSYKITAINDCGSRAGTAQSIAINQNVPDFNEFKVSKGLYPDLIELQWDINSPSVFKHGFQLKRAVYRDGLVDDDYTLIANNISIQTQFYEDRKIEPGIVYSYRLQGIDSCNGALNANNPIIAQGFAFPLGTITGRVTFEDGSAARDINVIAESDNNNNVPRSIRLIGGGGLKVSDFNKPVNLKDGFTFQTWLRPEPNTTNTVTIFRKSNTFRLLYQNTSTLQLIVNGQQLNMNISLPQDRFTHISAVFKPEGDDPRLAIYYLASDVVVDSARVAYTAGQITDEPDADLEFGPSYQGYIDEIRIWKRSQNFYEIFRNYSRFLANSEPGLAGYWRLNMGVAGEFYDSSKEGPEFNRNHGTYNNATGVWSDIAPTPAQLTYRGLTDENGDYIISALPFKVDGSLYKVVPIFEAQQFDPNFQNKFIGPGSTLVNDVNFVDISTFEISGLIRYANTFDFGVEGVEFYVDGNQVFDQNRRPVLSDEFGAFRIRVPIGKHYIEARKVNHVFENEGFFPPKDENDNFQTFDITRNRDDLEFIDNTLVKLSGRLVGGPVEAKKKIGFGKSINNIGKGRIQIRVVKERSITYGENDSTEIIDENFFVSRNTFNQQFITVEPDENSGEFAVLLPPEQYQVTGIVKNSTVINPNFPFDEQYHYAIDMRNTLTRADTLTDTLSVEIPSGTTQLIEYEEGDYDEIVTVSKGIITYTLGKKFFSYDLRRDFILRKQPDLTVEPSPNKPYFGEEIYNYVDDNLGIDLDVPLVDENNQYTFGRPVILQRKNYKWLIKLQESYYNPDQDFTDLVPVVDGKIKIVNYAALDRESDLELDSMGQTIYTFLGGVPNTTTPFTNDIFIDAYSGNNGAIKTIWREADPLRAYVFGGLPTGNNFITNGPNKIITILRDPPGSGSSTSLAKSSTTVDRSFWNAGLGFNTNLKLTAMFGSKTEIVTGEGIASINTFESKVDVVTGFTLNTEWIQNGESVSTTTNSKAWSTSSSPDFVGSTGDVFVGYSTNIVWGASDFLQLIPEADCTEDCLETSISGFKIGKNRGFRFNPEFETSFSFSQGHIENILLPNLINLRNSFLIYSTMPDTINPINNPVYISLVAPDDEKFGSSNEDEDIWGASVNTSNNNQGSGPSYIIKLPQEFIDNNTQVTDSVNYFNQEIGEWVFWLAENERQKLAAETDENISFDAGASITRSKTSGSSNTINNSFSGSLALPLGFNSGYNFDNFGFKVDFTVTTTISGGGGAGTTTSDEKTYDYTLADGNLGDSYTIDVKKPKDGFGPVFSVRGGATSCPYEDREVTKYYQPGKLMLHEATMQRERPFITIDPATRADIPSNRAAEFTLNLINQSETEEDFFYTLGISSNPDNALLSVEGLIGGGKTYLIKHGTPLTKTLKVSKGQDNVNDYENIELALKSVCQADPTDFQADVVSTAKLSAFFRPGCSDISLLAPDEHWVLNTNALMKDTLQITIGDYDRSFENFKYIMLQYRPLGESNWRLITNFYNPLQVTEEDFDQLQDPKAWIENNEEIDFLWDMSSLPDRENELRAVSMCELGPGTFVDTPTEIILGIKDTKKPKLFGTPQPADGILSLGDDISIRFDETLEAGAITDFNFTVQGLLANPNTDHATSISFDGENDQVRIPEGVVFSRSFSISFWVDKAVDGERQVLIHQSENGQLFEIGFDASDRLFVDFNNQEITTELSFDQGTAPETWYYYTVAYNSETRRLNAYRNGFKGAIIENQLITSPYTGRGETLVGTNGTDYFEGRMHSLKHYSQTLSLGDATIQMGIRPSGNEFGLLGFWPMDEANGKIAFDLARSRHASVSASWSVEPAGLAYQLNGNNYLQLNAQPLNIEPDMDFTVEFWFKGAAADNGAGGSTLLSNGLADGTDQFADPEFTWLVGLNPEGKLYVLHKGQEITFNQIPNQFLDNQYHHVALVMRRTANLNLFVDGELRTSANSDNMGGIQGDRIWIGTRAHKLNPVDIEYDQVFTGSIDEIRFWNLAKSRELINLYRNNKLTGEETGLIGYYPFEEFSPVFDEYQGNLDDQWININLLGELQPNGGTAVTVTGSAAYDPVDPGIRQTRPVEKIGFDYAVNDDEIIITLNANRAEEYERSIIEFTVQRLRDKYGNNLASPITWTAFIDQNPLKWQDDQIDITKPVYEPYSFEVNIVNRGGSEESFSITNLPVWLDASPVSGNLDPLQEQKITFTINESLYIGNYQAAAYLTVDGNRDEQLLINVSVTGNRPNWQLNPADFELSMNLVGSLTIEGIRSTDKQDLVAAFIGGELRGLASPLFVPEYDQYIVFMDIYANEGPDQGNLEFQVWDASTGTIYALVNPTDLSFEDKATLGTPAAPVSIETTEKVIQQIYLEEGWNWISFNVNADLQDDIPGLLSHLNAADGDIFKVEEASTDVNGFFVTYDGALNAWTGPDNSIDSKLMYKVRLSNPDTMLVLGEKVDVNNTTINLNPMWTRFAYLPQVNMEVNEALGSLDPAEGDVVKGQKRFAIYDNNLGWVGSLTFMRPGDGYMIHLANQDQLRYPERSVISSGRLLQEEEELFQQAPDYSRNMNIVAALSDQEIFVSESSRLVAKVNGKVRGVAKPQLVDNKFYFFLTAFSDLEGESFQFALLNEKQEELMIFPNLLVFGNDQTVGTIKKPYLLGEGIPGTIRGIYPNPFTDQLIIDYTMEETGLVRMELLDASGRVVSQIMQEEVAEGQHHFDWRLKSTGLADIRQGIYLLKVDTQNSSQIFKIIKN